MGGLRAVTHLLLELVYVVEEGRLKRSCPLNGDGVEAFEQLTSSMSSITGGLVARLGGGTLSSGTVARRGAMLIKTTFVVWKYGNTVGRSRIDIASAFVT